MAKYLFSLIILLILNGCSLYKNETLKKDLKLDTKTTTTLSGNFEVNKLSSQATYLILYKHRKGDKNNIKNYDLVDFHSLTNYSKNYNFKVNDGDYFLYACQNLEKLREKKYAYEFFSEIINIKKGEDKKIDIKLSTEARVVEDENILIFSKEDKSVFEKFSFERIKTIDNKIFNRKNASLGLWDPLKYYETIGGGLYLLEKYDPSKKVVVLVHGMKGTPIDFQQIIKNLDKNKYQSIVYFYPTGMNLNFSVDGLRYSLEKLQNKYNINSIDIIAHSMGGLVSRAFINSCMSLKINKFISIATPWNGQKFAALGGNMAKKIAPSFGNMIPKSAFIENNQNLPFPKQLKHYLLFAYKGKRSFVLDNSNDGVISLSSQLYEKAQKKAHFVYGFNETHTSILKSKETINLINKILDNKI